MCTLRAVGTRESGRLDVQLTILIGREVRADAFGRRQREFHLPPGSADAQQLRFHVF
jgi:hypothetical protein